MKRSIAIDMDDTVADTLNRHIEWYEREFGICISRNEMVGKKIYDVVPSVHLDKVRSFPHHPDFFRDLDVIDGAVEVIQRLSQKYNIYFASAAMEYPASFSAKYDWLRSNFPFINDMNFIFCGAKSFLNCDYLVDDSPRHIDAFSGKGFLFNAVHNVHETGYNRVNSWYELMEKLD